MDRYEQEARNVLKKIGHRPVNERVAILSQRFKPRELSMTAILRLAREQGQ